MEVDDTEIILPMITRKWDLVHNCSYRLAKIDVGEFGEDIITQGIQMGLPHTIQTPAIFQ